MPADREQPLRLGGDNGVRGEPEPGGGLPQQAGVARGLGGRDQQHEPGRFRQRLDPPEKALLDPARQRELVRHAEAARQLRRAQPARQLEQGQRVAVRLGQDPLPDLLIERPSHHRAQQRPGVLVPQSLRLPGPGTRRCSPGSRAAKISPTGSASSRRAANASTCADDRSSHWASSTTHSSGRSSATSDSSVRTASAIRNRSGASPSRSPNATPSASCCGAGSRSRRSSSAGVGSDRVRMPISVHQFSTRPPATARLLPPTRHSRQARGASPAGLRRGTRQARARPCDDCRLQPTDKQRYLSRGMISLTTYIIRIGSSGHGLTGGTLVWELRTWPQS